MEYGRIASKTLVFIGGSHFSGTSLLQAVIDTSNEVSVRLGLRDTNCLAMFFATVTHLVAHHCAGLSQYPCPGERGPASPGHVRVIAGVRTYSKSLP